MECGRMNGGLQYEAYLEKNEQALIEGLQKLIRINSEQAEPVRVSEEEIYPFGQGVQDCFQACMDLAKEMGFLTPFMSFGENYMPENPLVAAANAYTVAGKTPVTWTLVSIPSDNWKNQVGAALTQYAEGKLSWDDVKNIFVNSWASEYEITHAE